MGFQTPHYLALAAITFFLPHARAAENETKFEVYGFAMADYIQDFRRVNSAWEDTLRPTRIPTTGGAYGSDVQASLSVKQSRFGVQGTVPIAGKSLKTQFEFDFFGVGVDEGQTTIRLRHAYGEWNGWLAGQTNSLFMDIDAFPNVIDYWGPSGMVFFRNVQIRWTPISGPYSLSVALERPISDIDSGQIRALDPSLGTGIKADEKLPDLTAQARVSGTWGHALLGGILRRVGYDTPGAPDNAPKGFKIGWGLNLSSSLIFGEKNKLILAGVYGQGIASYMNDGGTDLAPEGSPGALSPKAVPLLGVMVYYDHYWSERWSTTLGFARTQVDNTTFQAGDAFFRGDYASINLLYTPDKKVMAGVELLWGGRTDHSGAIGTDVRSQVSFKYSFSSGV